ncbi:centrosomal protein of 70 kDa [Rhinatrema bivittatum]|uniref:centrosomal protein of 70 kDa n=1 Tax=Rhinatrema bivittatum TaxID=194408 RepID=UPI00112D8AB0|nr:centrosomal protein of 70 kDa [Rhinatrema bivittatum]
MSVHLEDRAVEIREKEEAEWESINKLLKQHGLKPVSLTKPREGRNVSDVVVLDKQTSLDVRSALKRLVEDSERRQIVIQGLIQANTQLRNDIQQQQGRASRQEQRATNLEQILETVKSKIRELEDDFIAQACQQQTQLKELQKDKQATENQYQQQKQQLVEQEERIAQLQKKLHMLVRGEEQRLARQSRAFRQFHKRAPRFQSALDEPLLDVIDSYESQIHNLQKELRKYEDSSESTEERGKDKDPLLNLDATPNYKALLKSYQDQLREWKTKNEQLLRENGNLMKELEIRPHTKEFKSYKQQVKRMEKILLQNKIKYSTKGLVRGEKVDEKKEESESTRVEHIDQLKAKLCRTYLKNVCKELDIQDLNDLVSVASKRTKQAEVSSNLDKMLTNINSIVSGPGAPQLLYRKKSDWNKDNSQGPGFEHLLPTIMMWADQLRSLKDLHGSLKTLALKLGQLPVDSTQDAHKDFRVEDLLLTVDTILEEIDHKGQDDKGPPFQMLQSFVSHFQKLFDVTSLNGIYPRLNEVYTKLGEMNNAMRAMCELLGLDHSAPASVLVNMVGRLCGVIKEQTNRQVLELFGDLDINSIIRKLEDYEEFFPAFETLIQDLLQTLEINNLDDIMPAVQTLKMVTAKK